MKLTVKSPSGSLDIEVSDSDTIAEVLKKGMEKHKCPAWADGVQLKVDGQGEDLAEDASKSLGSLGVAAGTSLHMAYYQDVLPSEAKKLKLQGLLPGTTGPFLAKKG
mmetsp:Transcript_128418/g.191380  ORF Transcript_128418/g.191380 Transcript_128418/m.191380 type:complete len:107 (-) Transcript_128418:104-424(-)